MGYEASAFSPFRHHEMRPANTKRSSPELLTPRKCSLPVRRPGFDDGLPTEVSLQESRRLALRSLLYDFESESSNTCMSRTYLPGFAVAVSKAGLDSDLAKAGEAVSLGSHARPLDRPVLIERAEVLYQDALTSFAREMKQPSASREQKATAIFMGLYEVCLQLSDRSS
jgi:hypothetical protein